MAWTESHHPQWSNHQNRTHGCSRNRRKPTRHMVQTCSRSNNVKHDQPWQHEQKSDALEPWKTMDGRCGGAGLWLSGGCGITTEGKAQRSRCVNSSATRRLGENPPSAWKIYVREKKNWKPNKSKKGNRIKRTLGTRKERKITK